MVYSESHAMETESDYPYHAKDETCKDDASKGVVNTVSINNVRQRSADQLLAAIDAGPTAVTVDASSADFQLYKSGVLNSATCGTQLNHAITAIGYGNSDGQDYYIVRNSWGTSWGDKGYINIATSKGTGICGIQQVSLWPTTN